MRNVIRKVISSRKRTELEHPKGLRLVIERDVFPRDSEVEIIGNTKVKLTYADSTFRASSTEVSVKAMDISIRLDYEPGTPSKYEKLVPFVEINEAGKTYLLAGELNERIVGKHKEYCVVVRCELFKKELDVSIGAGVFIYPIEVKQVFHPVQHQFKIAEEAMEQDTDGHSRRRNEDGDPCKNPNPVDIYPACYPASWASLCSSYRMTPLHPRRRWEMGTPTELNPPPNEFGDFFSTWAMGTEEPGDPPCVTRVEDWQADPADPTPNTVIMETLTFPVSADEGEREARAALIKSVLLREVGGHSPPSSHHIVAHPRPVRMDHGGHAWIIVGVDKDGFWEHALATDAWAFSNYCLWEEAPWINDDKTYYISFPPYDCGLKPEERRLGCINLEGSSNKMKRVRFWDVYTNVYTNYTNIDENIIHWTPHTRTDPGYLWILGNEPLTCLGFPESAYHRDLGHIIPQPIKDFGHCRSCGNSEDGCSHCRLRLLLPFWVHNTTLDELVTYKVDLYFWSKDQRWVTLHANSLPEETARTEDDDLYCGFDCDFGNYRWTKYKLPGPLPGERFSIQAIEDTDPGLPRPEPWNSQGFAWYIDFHRNQLTYGVHGIRIVLTCIERSAEPLCLVQDVKQIWFRVSHSAPA
jgi:hypothetical protein